MDVWDWVREARIRARASNDIERSRFMDLFYQGMELRRSSPDRALERFSEGRALAEQARENWWVLLFDHWRLQTLHTKRDFAAALDLAVRSVVEVRKPAYSELPQRVCLHEDLITAYVNTDPRGFAPLIEEALTYMERQVVPAITCYHCLQSLRMDFELDIGDVQAAFEACLRSLAACQAHQSGSTQQHHLTGIFAGLCRVAFYRSDWVSMRDCAAAGLETCLPAQEAVRPRLLAWQALAARHLGNERVAQQACAQALIRASHITYPLGSSYYNALAAYFVAGGEQERAWQVREDQLALLNGRTGALDEFRCRLERCKLLRILGRHLDEEMAAARAVAGRMKDPAPYLRELADAASGSDTTTA